MNARLELLRDTTLASLPCNIIYEQGYLLLNRKSDGLCLPQQAVTECFNGTKVIIFFSFLNKTSIF